MNWKRVTLIWGVFVFCILSHEAGHMVMAMALGISVDSFNFGYGPKLAEISVSGVHYAVRLIPLGGFVEIPHMKEMHWAVQLAVGFAGIGVNLAMAGLAVVLLAGQSIAAGYAWSDVRADIRELGRLTVVFPLFLLKAPYTASGIGGGFVKNLHQLEKDTRMRVSDDVPGDELDPKNTLGMYAFGGPMLFVFAMGVSIGLFNVLPLGALDGGRMFALLLPESWKPVFFFLGDAYVLGFYILPLLGGDIVHLVKSQIRR